MVGDDAADAVADSRSAATREAFERRVREQADRIRSDIRSGRLDTGEYAVGMELEAYAVDGEGRPTEIPEAVFERADCGTELGVHNLEVNSPATPFDAAGVADQAAHVEGGVAAADRALDDAGLRLVLDAMWTVPPAGGTDAYLGSVERRDGMVAAANMRHNPRYVALDNDLLGHKGGTVTVDVPGARLEHPTILAESLTTSIQPHLQVPEVEAFPRQFNAALRTLGPVLSLATNSPFLPADCYTDDPDVVDATHHELRVTVFEESINAAPENPVRFPADLERPTDVVDAVLDDETYAPVLYDEGEKSGYRATIREYDHKRGTHWRWVRGVVGGQPVGSEREGASLRIEYRPLPTQPTVRDAIGLQLLTVGLLRGLAEADHPLPDLPWDAARDCFYDVVSEGPDAELAWVTETGERTGDRTVVYDEVFEYARRGLRAAGLDDDAIDDYLDPIERRRDGSVPSAWKKARVRDALDDGATLPEAIERMQRAYIERSGGDVFADW
jgi:hypothetical protein